MNVCAVDFDRIARRFHNTVDGLVGINIMSEEKKCKKCGDRLNGHEDESGDTCRWCNTGWIPSKPEDEACATSA